MIETYKVSSGAAAGSAGAATATGTSTHPIVGRLLGVLVKYQDSPPATTDVTVKTKGEGGKPSITLLTLTDQATDKMVLVRNKIADETGADITYDGTNEVYEPPALADYVQAVIDGANAGDSVDVWLIVDAGR